MTTIYLDDKRRETAEIIPKLQHAFAGLPLLMTAVDHLREGVDLPVASLELIIAVVVLGTFVKDLRAAVRHRFHAHAAHSVVGWFDLAAGAMLMFEAFHGAHHKPAYLRPQFLTALVTIGLGLLHPQLHAARHKRRYLKLDESGVDYRPHRFRRWHMDWKEIDRIEWRPGKAVLHQANGRTRTINLRTFHNADAIREAFIDHERLPDKYHEA